eukprot:TRINITY_DN457_c0_g1_i2.p1 TRINITY_DN457_c0_g1~~TRINITY_DN457_c0_g1_i2.p1  ORF type:complete len:498 (-),score=105.60 TRINITY_DN457_c0_g1_i2:129-1622(-)
MAVGRSETQPKSVTWKELATHNTKDDCWVAVDGKVYNVTSWLPKHPGGDDLVLMSAGRDITNLFESYHPLSDLPCQVLKKFYVCDIADNELPRFVNKSPFYQTLSQRIKAHFKARNIDPQHDWRIYLRHLSVFVLFLGAFYFAHFFTSNTLLSCLFAIVFGASEAIFGMHVLHDACHAAVSHKPFVWRYLGACYEQFIGASFYAWMHQHVIGHHVYTNVRNADPDLGEGEVDFRRVSPYQPKHWFYRFQHIYAPLMYCLLVFKYRIQDAGSYTHKMNGRIRVGPTPLFWLLSYVSSKGLFLLARLVLPYFLSANSFAKIILYMVISEIVHGYYLALIFQVSHVADDLDFHITTLEDQSSEPAPINEDWAMLQVKTTQDYAHNAGLTSYFTGALNYQVVHHLFPTVSQTFYPEIAPIVLQTCKEYNVPYKVLPDFTSAVLSHLSYLKKMGDPNALFLEMPSNAVNGEWSTHPTTPAANKDKKAQPTTTTQQRKSVKSA